MTRRRKIFLIALAVMCAAIAAIVAAAVIATPGWLRGAAERAASQALGRDLRIAGPVELTWSLAPALTAHGITLANAPWASEPSMVRVGRASVRIELASLWSRPVRVREVVVEDVRVLLEGSGEGRGNWMFDLPPRPKPARPRPPGPVLVVEHAAVRGFELDYRPRPAAKPVCVTVTKLEATLEQPSGMIDLRGDGRFNGVPWEIAGRLGTLEKLLAAHDVDQALTGRIGQSTLELRGRVRDPLTLGEPNLELSVDGPDVRAALANFGLSAPLTGPFHLRSRLTPAEDGVAFVLDAALNDSKGSARGVVSALLAPDRLDATVEASGRDASEVGAWTGIEGLPPRPFELSGRVRRGEAALAVDNVAIRVGPTSLALSGLIGPPPRCVGTRLDVRGSGSDLSELSALAHLDLPAGPFAVQGRFLRRADGLALGPTRVRFREALIAVEGAIGEPPGVASLDLAVDASGPDLSWFSGLATVELPPEPFVVRGRVARDGSALVLEDVAGRLGDIGANLSGRIVPVKGMLGTEADIHVAGPDLAEAAALAKLHGAPGEPFDARGRVRIGENGYELDGVEATVGRVAVAATGRIGSPSVLEGTTLACRAHGPSLADLGAWGLPRELPPDPFSVSGNLRVRGGAYEVTDAVAEVGSDRVRVDGALGPVPDLSRLDVAVRAAGPSVSALGRFLSAAGLEPPTRLPSASYDVSGRVRLSPAGYDLDDVRAIVGETALRVRGTLGSEGTLPGTDVRVDGGGPDTSLLSELAGTALPDGPFEIHGRLTRVEAGVLCDGVSVTMGDAHAEISGTLGALPGLFGTDLDVRVAGGDLSATLGPPTGLEALPNLPFELSAHLAGSVDGVTSDRLAARLGGSDLEGRASIHLQGRPSVEAELRSHAIDVRELLAGSGGEAPDDPQSAAPARKPRTKRDRRRDRLIPDDPLPLAALGRFDATLRLTAARIAIPGVPLRDVVVSGALRDGALHVEKVEGTGVHGGRASASVTLEPAGEGWRLRTEGRLDAGRLTFPNAVAASAEKAPSLDVEFDLTGEGRTPHQLATSGEGRVLVVVGPGEVPNAMNEFVTSDIVKGLLDALNPFRKSSDHTDVECGIASANVTAGKAAVEPIAARTDKMTVIGRGKLDFETEAVDLVWTIKSRRGVGLSASSIANPYVKLGGTLAAPSLDVKPLEAAASTGAAVAPAGLTILLRSIYNRITAEKKVCVDALAKARKQMAERAGRAGTSRPVSLSP